MSNLNPESIEVPPNELGWSSVATEAPPKSKTVLALFVAVRAGR